MTANHLELTIMSDDDEYYDDDEYFYIDEGPVADAVPPLTHLSPVHAGSLQYHE